MPTMTDRELVERVAKACGYGTVYPLLVRRLTTERTFAENALRAFCKRHGLLYTMKEDLRKEVGHSWSLQIFDTHGEQIGKSSTIEEEALVPRAICEAIVEAWERVKGDYSNE